jgi:hypothetical protein
MMLNKMLGRSSTNTLLDSLEEVLLHSSRDHLFKTLSEQPRSIQDKCRKSFSGGKLEIRLKKAVYIQVTTNLNKRLEFTYADANVQFRAIDISSIFNQRITVPENETILELKDLAHLIFFVNMLSVGNYKMFQQYIIEYSELIERMEWKYKNNYRLLSYELLLKLRQPVPTTS